MDFFKRWFEDFDEGLNHLSDDECGRLFRPCARHCANEALKNLYQNLFDDCGGQLDLFFERLHEVDGVDGTVVQQGHAYEIIFRNCNCDLHTCAHVNSVKLCECSRQSILCELKILVPDRDFSVEKLETILNGDCCCRFRITAL